MSLSKCECNRELYRPCCSRYLDLALLWHLGVIACRRGICRHWHIHHWHRDCDCGSISSGGLVHGCTALDFDGILCHCTWCAEYSSEAVSDWCILDAVFSTKRLAGLELCDGCLHREESIAGSAARTGSGVHWKWQVCLTSHGGLPLPC